MTVLPDTRPGPVGAVESFQSFAEVVAELMKPVGFIRCDEKPDFSLRIQTKFMGHPEGERLVIIQLEPGPRTNPDEEIIHQTLQFAFHNGVGFHSCHPGPDPPPGVKPVGKLSLKAEQFKGFEALHHHIHPAIRESFFHFRKSSQTAPSRGLALGKNGHTKGFARFLCPGNKLPVPFFKNVEVESFAGK